jgi:hypothetical protein
MKNFLLKLIFILKYSLIRCFIVLLAHKKSLEEDIKGDTSGTFREILISLLNAGRASGNMVDKTQAKLDAQNLINSGIKKWGTADVSFNY